MNYSFCICIFIVSENPRGNSTRPILPIINARNLFSQREVGKWEYVSDAYFDFVTDGNLMV